MILIPTKDDEGLISAQPLCFHLKASFITKIVVKKLNINAALYEIVPVNVEIDLPINSNINEFTVSIMEESDQEKNYCPSFFLLSSEKRTLAYGKDKLELKFTSLDMGRKNCKITYFCPVIG